MQKKRTHRGWIIFGVIVAILALLIVSMINQMGKTMEQTLAAQVNTDINMAEVRDGTYTGESDAGMVKVEVSVTVNDHCITDIDLIRHENGRGKPAEAILGEMIAQNTDDVDMVSGATASSKTIRNAVNNALQKGLAA